MKVSKWGNDLLLSNTLPEGIEVSIEFLEGVRWAGGNYWPHGGP